MGVLVYATLKYKKSKITVRVIIWAPKYFIFSGKNSLNATLICIMIELGVPVKLRYKSFILDILT